jgi:hypothetical protein
VIRRDLELSGWFKLIDPPPRSWSRRHRNPSGRVQVRGLGHPGAVALGKTALAATGDGKLRAEVWVYDVPGRASSVRKRSHHGDGFAHGRGIAWRARSSTW